MKRISIVGSAGVPANYGGFETLAENLVRFHYAQSLPYALVIYNSNKGRTDLCSKFLSAEQRYVPLSANGVQSVLYDIWSLFSALRNGCDVILLLGVSGAIALPLVRLISSVRVVTNVDGIEWRRDKWGSVAKYFLRFSEMLAVRFSHDVIADNEAISEYLHDVYGVSGNVIAYGGDHVLNVEAVPVTEFSLPSDYIFSVCRIEPENNIEIILSAFSRMQNHTLVLVGNWANSEYGAELRERYSENENIYMLDPIYELGKLKYLRSNATYYIHGHSAGGTNPSLVEAMHFGKPIIAYDCEFNRYTTENAVAYFLSETDIVNILGSMTEGKCRHIGEAVIEIARRRYTWNVIAKDYFTLFDKGTF